MWCIKKESSGDSMNNPGKKSSDPLIAEGWDDNAGQPVFITLETKKDYEKALRYMKEQGISRMPLTRLSMWEQGKDTGAFLRPSEYQERLAGALPWKVETKTVKRNPFYASTNLSPDDPAKGHLFRNPRRRANPYFADDSISAGEPVAGLLYRNPGAAEMRTLLINPTRRRKSSGGSKKGVTIVRVANPRPRRRKSGGGGSRPIIIANPSHPRRRSRRRNPLIMPNPNRRRARRRNPEKLGTVLERVGWGMLGGGAVYGLDRLLVQRLGKVKNADGSYTDSANGSLFRSGVRVLEGFLAAWLLPGSFAYAVNGAVGFMLAGAAEQMWVSAQAGPAPTGTSMDLHGLGMDLTSALSAGY